MSANIDVTTIVPGIKLVTIEGKAATATISRVIGGRLLVICRTSAGIKVDQHDTSMVTEAENMAVAMIHRHG